MPWLDLDLALYSCIAICAHADSHGYNPSSGYAYAYLCILLVLVSSSSALSMPIVRSSITPCHRHTPPVIARSTAVHSDGWYYLSLNIKSQKMDSMHMHNIMRCHEYMNTSILYTYICIQVSYAYIMYIYIYNI